LVYSRITLGLIQSTRFRV